MYIGVHMVIQVYKGGIKYIGSRGFTYLSIWGIGCHAPVPMGPVGFCLLLLAVNLTMVSHMGVSDTTRANFKRQATAEDRLVNHITCHIS